MSELIDSNVKKNFFKNTAIYTLVKYIALLMGFLREMVNAKALGPEQLGVLGNLVLIISYLLYANFGVIYAMTKECSTGERDKGECKKIIDGTFSFLILISAAFIFMGGSYMYYSGFSEMSIYIFIVFLIGIFDQYRLYFTNYFRIKDSLREINKIEIIYNILSMIITVVLINVLHIYGVLIGLLLSDVVVFVSSLRRAEKISFTIDLSIISILVKVGVPLLVYNLGFYILTTIDRIMIIKYLTSVDLGYYTFANQIAKATLVFLNSILFIYYPKALKELNLNSNADCVDIIGKIQNLNSKLEIVAVLLSVVGIIVILPFVTIFMNEYMNSILIYRILVLAVIVNQLSYFASVFLLSNAMQMKLVKLQVVISICSVILNYIFIKANLGLAGVSIATMIINMLYSVFQFIILRNVLSRKISLKEYYYLILRYCLFSVSIIITVLLVKEIVIEIFLFMFILFVFYRKVIIQNVVDIKGYIKKK